MGIIDYIKMVRQLGLNAGVAVLLLGLQVFGAIFEGLGLGMMLPVAQIMMQGNRPETAEMGSRFGRFLQDLPAKLGFESGLAGVLIISFLLLLVRQALGSARQLTIMRTQLNLIRDTRNRMFELFLDADQNYHEGVQVGTVVNDMTTELERAIGAGIGGITLVNYCILAAAYVALMGAVSPTMTGSVMAILAICYFPVRAIMRRTKGGGLRSLAANQAMSAFLVERLSNTRLIRLSGTEDAEREHLSKLTGNQRDQYLWLSVLNTATEIVMEPTAIGLAYVMLFVGYTEFGMGVPEVGVFLIIVMRLVPISKSIMQTRQSVTSNLGSLKAVVSRMSEMETAKEPVAGNASFHGFERNLTFEGVVFHYEGRSDVPALDRIKLQIPAGRMTALVGPSGSGKSTLIDMIPRLRLPTSGVITFDGKPSDEFDLTSLRSGISYAAQLPQVFDVTIEGHIRYGKRSATVDEIRDAAQLAGALEFIEALPNGFQTRLGASGVRLSGGQRQRLDLARAIIRHAPVLILDEPTSNLDAESEEAFRQTLLRLRERGATIIVIAHRLASIADADQIVVMNQGRIEAVGTHEKLLGEGGWYARAFAQQDAGRFVA